MNPFGMEIRKARKAKGLTLETLARKVGTHKGYISGWEKGSVNPPSAALTMKVAKVLDLNGRRLMILAWAQKSPLPIRADVVAHWGEIATLLGYVE